MQGLFITSNNTGVGKTFVSQYIIKAIDSDGVVARKPLETNCKIINNKLFASDAYILNQSCKNPEAIEVVCPYMFSQLANGEVASMGKNITIDDLLSTCRSDNFMVIEGAGGFYSPLVKNCLNSDFAKKLNFPVVIVIDDKLGAISEALLTIEAVKKQGLTIAFVILNQITPNNLENKLHLEKWSTEKIVEFNKGKLDDFSLIIQFINYFR